MDIQDAIQKLLGLTADQKLPERMRMELLDNARKLVYSLERPEDALTKLAFSVCFPFDRSEFCC